jgi:hypothetical protein
MRRDDHSHSFQKFKKKRKFDDPEGSDFNSSKEIQKFQFVSDQREFRCINCKEMIFPPNFGTEQRNHCPNCLVSLHLDHAPGDRSSGCGSKMEAISIWVRRNEWIIIHRCLGCAVIHANRIAPDDNESMLIHLASQAMAKPSFPLYEEFFDNRAEKDDL